MTFWSDSLNKSKEQRILAPYGELRQGIERAGAEQDYRPLRYLATDLEWQLQEQQLELNFSLPSGCFATALVRELVRY